MLQAGRPAGGVQPLVGSHVHVCGSEAKLPRPPRGGRAGSLPTGHACACTCACASLAPAQRLWQTPLAQTTSWVARMSAGGRMSRSCCSRRSSMPSSVASSPGAAACEARSLETRDCSSLVCCRSLRACRSVGVGRLGLGGWEVGVGRLGLGLALGPAGRPSSSP